MRRMLVVLITPSRISNALTGGLSEVAIRHGCRIRPIALLYNTLSGVIRKTSSEAHDKSILFYKAVLIFA